MDREELNIQTDENSSTEETDIIKDEQNQDLQEKIEETKPKKETKKMKAKDYVFMGVLSVIIVILGTYILLFSTVFYHVVVSGSSMSPTLTSGDILVAKRDVSTINRGDVIIIANKASAGSLLIKRAIGIEGDIIVIEGGKVYRNNELLKEDYVLKQDATFAPDSTDDSATEKRVYEIGENEVFFLGDNRTDSLDSRYYGTCELENIVGIVEQSAIDVKDITTAINKVIIKIKGFFGIKSYGTITNDLQ